MKRRALLLWLALSLRLAIPGVLKAEEGAPSARLSLASNPQTLPSIAKITTVHPLEINEPLVNPYCGWGIWAGPRFYDGRQFSVEYKTMKLSARGRDPRLQVHSQGMVTENRK